MKKKIGLAIIAGLLIASIPVFYSSMPDKKANEKKQVASQESVEFLTKMGLTNSKTVKENFDLIDRQKRDKYMKELGVLFYSANAIKALLKAQDLVLGDLKDYTGEIPEVNIKEFKATYGRMKPDVKYSHYFVVNLSNHAVVEYIPESDIKPQFINRIKNPVVFSALINWTSDVLKANPYQNLSAVSYESNSGPITPESLKIAAPQKYFNMEGKDVDSDGNIFTRPKRVDPMILMPYEDGYIVLTSWF